MNLTEKINELLKKKLLNEKEKNDSNVTTTTYKTDSYDEKKRQNLIDEVKYYLNEKKRIENIPELEVATKTYTPKSDEEILKTATEGVNPLYESKLNKLKNDVDAEISGYNNLKQQTEKSTNVAKENVANYYDDLGEELSSQAIKRGIQRSSIVAGQLKDLGESEVKTLTEIEKELLNELNGISSKIEKAKKDYATAVSDLDVKKVVEINELVNELKDKELKKQKEIDEFNMKAVAEMEKANSFINKEKASELLLNRRNMLNAVINYFYKMPREERMQAFKNDSELLNLLGDDVSYLESYLI